VLLAIAVFALAARGDDDDEAAAPATPTETAEPSPSADSIVNVTVAEWAVTPNTSSVSAGDVTFLAFNKGGTAHELEVIRSDEEPHLLPVEGRIVPAFAVDLVGEIEAFPAGEAEQATFHLTAGNYVLICNLPSHYLAGMRSGFTVN
jgi:uncharacterized cupredoxin-like copper-binding protein